MSLDRLDQIVRAAVVQEEEPLPETPERRCPELVALCEALQDVVSEPRAHGVQRQVGVEICGLVAKRLDRGFRIGFQGRRVAERAAETRELRAPATDRGRPARTVGRRLGWRQEALEV